MQFHSPKNFKRGRLIFNRYRPIDLVFAGGTITVTLVAEMIYLLFLNGSNLGILFLLTLPAIIGVCLLIPFEIYHNPIQMIQLYLLFQKRQRFYQWEGFYYDDIRKKEEKAGTDS